MKKYLLFCLLVFFLSSVSCLGLGGNLVKQASLANQLRDQLSVLRQEHDRLERQVAHLSSLSKIADSAQKAGLVRDQSRLVFVASRNYAVK
ncbi:MAG: hypothetical protein ABID04_04365 [Patescibacteria group bacterium]